MVKKMCLDCSKQDYCTLKNKVDNCNNYKKRTVKKGVLKEEKINYF